MPRKASPLSSTSIGNLLGAIFLFTTWYVFCLEHLVSFASLLVSLPQSSLLYTPFERSIHDSEFVRILYVLHLYLLSLIVLLIVLHLYLLSVIIFALVIHLDLFVRTPTRCHIDLAGNTSYHFAASRTVFPRVSPYLRPGPFAPFGSRIW